MLWKELNELRRSRLDTVVFTIGSHGLTLLAADGLMGHTSAAELPADLTIQTIIDCLSS